ncbi:MAG: hypothetical protein LBN43_06290 [Oscillospiraceae bacterium]|jgi:hypothetical protein|nr:hypothetical protein [Oscillospiraceae bacterium]
MAFLHQEPSGFYAPLEYFSAAPGTYVKGQLLHFVSGKLAALSAVTSTTPPWVCEDNVTIAATPESGALGIVGGDVVGVTRIDTDSTFQTTLSVAIAALAIGQKLSVTADGLQVNATAGTFEVQAFDDTAIGSKVTGRFNVDGVNN